MNYNSEQLEAEAMDMRHKIVVLELPMPLLYRVSLAIKLSLKHNSLSQPENEGMERCALELKEFLVMVSNMPIGNEMKKALQ